jgi:hypothetical protein
MSESRVTDTVADALLALGVVAGVVELFYRPFGTGPIGVIAVLIGSAIGTKRRGLGLAVTAFVALCFLIGASIAIWNSRALY